MAQRKTKPEFSGFVALLISIYFPPEPSGGSTAAWNRAMILHKIGYSVFVICGFPAYPSGKVTDPKYKGKIFYIETLEPFTVIRLRLLPIAHIGYIKRLIVFLNFVVLTIIYIPIIIRIAGKISIVYSLAPIIFSSISGFAYSVFTKSLFVYEAADLWPEELVAFRTYLLPIIISIGKVAAKLSYSAPDIIVTVSKLAAEYISKEYAPKAPIYALPIGVDPNKFPRISKDTARLELIRRKILPKDLQNKFIILYSGLISTAQKIENLAYAADKLKGEGGIATLVVGEGEEKQKLEQLKVSYKLDNLFLLPYQPRDIIPTIISAADVCIVTLSPEPIFGIAVPTKFYEYLACHKPIIGLCRGELEEIIKSTSVGYVVTPDDIDKLVSIVRYFENSPALLKTLESNSHSALERFSLDSLSSNLLEILKKEMYK